MAEFKSCVLMMSKSNLKGNNQKEETTEKVEIKTVLFKSLRPCAAVSSTHSSNCGSIAISAFVFMTNLNGE